MSERYDAIIVGGGPAGATAAIFLAQAGWSVALVEKERFPRRKVCGECIAATNLELLDALGIGTAFHEIAGAPLRNVALMAGHHIVEAPLPSLQAGKHAWGKALGREHLDTLLVARAKQVGATIFQPWVVRSITGEPGNYHCQAVEADSGEQRSLTAPVLIAAHGSWQLAPDATSGTRERKRPAAPGDLFAFKANFQDAALDVGAISVLAFSGGYGGMVIGDHNTMTLACCVQRNTLTKARHDFASPSAADAVQQLLMRSCAGVRRALLPATQNGAWLSTGPIRPGIRIRRSSNIFLIGNAAGEAHPIVGEGMSMAMQSAWLLSSMLIEQRQQLSNPLGFSHVLEHYARTWQICFAQRIRLAAILAHTAMRPHAMTLLLPLLRQWPMLLTTAAHYSGKTKPIDRAVQGTQPFPSFR